MHKHIIALILLLLPLGTLPMMAQASLSEEDKQKVAEGACECLEPLVGLEEEARALENEPDEEKVIAYIEKAEPIFTESIQCMAELVAKYPAAEEADEKEMNAILRETCPEVAEIMK